MRSKLPKGLAFSTNPEYPTTQVNQAQHLLAQPLPHQHPSGSKFLMSRTPWTLWWLQTPKRSSSSLKSKISSSFQNPSRKTYWPSWLQFSMSRKITALYWAIFPAVATLARINQHCYRWNGESFQASIPTKHSAHPKTFFFSCFLLDSWPKIKK